MRSAVLCLADDVCVEASSLCRTAGNLLRDDPGESHLFDLIGRQSTTVSLPSAELDILIAVVLRAKGGADWLPPSTVSMSHDAE